MAFKKERIEKIIEREVGSILMRESKDDRLRYVTVTYCKVTPDLSYATVYFTVIGDEHQKQATSNSLQEAKGFIRSQLSQKLDIRKTPELIFKYDESNEYGNRIDEILKTIK